MANTAQARKRARQAEVRRTRNVSQRSAMRTAIKKTIAAVQTGDYETAPSAYRAVVPVLDRAVTHGLIQKNKAARHKSRLNIQVKALMG
ncbi:MAG TPA: 30S ribosomal protein S20 [Gammaproteobacteria bacterium]|nr:30S ribosomal protein S20 [Gammaproteobacteria bacterium]